MSEFRAIAARQPAGGIALIQSIQDAWAMAQYVANSKLFNCSNPAEAMVKIVAGAEMSFPAIAAMTDIHIIEGKPSIGAHLMASAIRKSGKYDFEIREHTTEVCSIAFFRLVNGAWKEQGVVTTTIQQAKDNGWNVTKSGQEKPTWRTKPKNMLFARTISDGYKWYCPDLTGGMLVYDRDEIEVESGSFAVSPPPPTNSLPHRPVNDDPERATPLTVDGNGQLRDDLDSLTEIRNSIDGLLAELQIPSEALKSRLATHFGGVASHLEIDNFADLRRLEGELLRTKRTKAHRQQTAKKGVN